MTGFHVEVVRLGKIEPHPNADTLSITRVHDYPVILRTGEYREGDIAVYVPVDAVVPDTEAWAFLGGHRRIRAKRLRGVFSQGLLTKAADFLHVGDEVAQSMGITRYEPPEDLATNGDNEPGPSVPFPVYTDIESYRRWGSQVFKPGEAVYVVEKIHGANARYMHDGDRLWVGSRTGVKRYDPRSIWWQAAVENGLEGKLARYPGLVLYGEVYGQVQDLKYGVQSGVRFRAFDAFDPKLGRYMDPFMFWRISFDLDFEIAPLIDDGAVIGEDDLYALAEGESLVGGPLREGVVIRPVQERYDDRIGRVILKLHGEGFLTRKGTK